MKRLTLAVTALFMGLNLSAQWRFGNQPVQNNVQSDLEKSAGQRPGEERPETRHGFGADKQFLRGQR